MLEALVKGVGYGFHISSDASFEIFVCQIEVHVPVLDCDEPLFEVLKRLATGAKSLVYHHLSEEEILFGHPQPFAHFLD